MVQRPTHGTRLAVIQGLRQLPELFIHRRAAELRLQSSPVMFGLLPEFSHLNLTRLRGEPRLLQCGGPTGNDGIGGGAVVLFGLDRGVELPETVAFRDSRFQLGQG